jgi:hypothetical protein
VLDVGPEQLLADRGTGSIGAGEAVEDDLGGLAL